MKERECRRKENGKRKRERVMIFFQSFRIKGENMEGEFKPSFAMMEDILASKNVDDRDLN